MNELIVANISVRTDAVGRYCLNDLHRAAGGNPSHRPGEWLRNKQAQELVRELGGAEIPAGPVSTINDGINNGTFVAKELVYAYAMWISAAFHLKVIRAYDSMVTNSAPANPANLTRMQLLELAMQAEQERAALESKVVQLTPKAEALDLIAAGTGSITITEAAKVLGMKCSTLTKWLHANGWVYRRNGAWVAYDTKTRSQDLEYKEGFYTDEVTHERKFKPYCHVTPKGLSKLAVIFKSGGLAA